MQFCREKTCTNVDKKEREATIASRFTCGLEKDEREKQRRKDGRKISVRAKHKEGSDKFSCMMWWSREVQSGREAKRKKERIKEEQTCTKRFVPFPLLQFLRKRKRRKKAFQGTFLFEFISIPFVLFCLFHQSVLYSLIISFPALPFFLLFIFYQFHPFPFFRSQRSSTYFDTIYN